MSENTSQMELAAPELSIPDESLATHILREMEWNERIEGSIFDPGPGLVVQRIYRLKHLSNFMDAAPNFTVDMLQLQTWLRAHVGDPELSDAVGEVIARASEPAEETDTRVDVRKEVAGLLRLRVQQCAVVLEPETPDEAIGTGDE
ncbi:MAG: hypothetical protein ACYC6C_03235 [Coriobacteriia bacterium]